MKTIAEIALIPLTVLAFIVAIAVLLVALPVAWVWDTIYSPRRWTR